MFRFFTSKKPETRKSRLAEDPNDSRHIQFAKSEIKRLRRQGKIVEHDPVKFLANHEKFYKEYLESPGVNKLNFGDWYKVYRYELELKHKYDELFKNGETPLSYKEWYNTEDPLPSDPELLEEYNSQKKRYDVSQSPYDEYSIDFPRFTEWKERYRKNKMEEKRETIHSTPDNFDISSFANGKRKTKRHKAMRKTQRKRKHRR